MNYNKPSTQKGFLNIGWSAIKSFFQFSNISVYLIIGLVLVYGYYRINMLEAENETLQTKNNGLRDDIEETKQEYNDLVTDVNEFRDRVNENLSEQRNITQEIQETRVENEEEIQELRKLFNESSSGEERDFENLARQKPDMIEKRVNEGTREFSEKVEKVLEDNKSKESIENSGDNNENNND